jgi:Uncharacterized protein conserved in bacteria
MIVNFGPGGVTDLMARALASGMEKDLGQPVVVQNRPGALGTLGPAYVSKQAPDGYTLGTVSASVVTTTPHLMNVAVKPEDLIQVAGFGKNRYGIVVKQDSPLKTIDDLVQSAKGEKSVLFGSPSTPNSLIFFDLGRKTGGKFELVSYKAGPTGPQRYPLLPNVPTAAESGIKDFAVRHYVGIFGPPGLPDEIADKLNDEINKILQEPQVKAAFEAQGDMATAVDRQTFAKTVATDARNWGALAQQMNLAAN